MNKNGISILNQRIQFVIRLQCSDVQYILRPAASNSKGRDKSETVENDNLENFQFKMDNS